MPAEFYKATAMMYMYSGLPFVPYFPMISSACVPPQCTGQVSYLPSPTRREDLFFRGYKSMERPLGLPSGPQAGGDSVAVPGPNNTNGRSVKLLAEGCPSSTMVDGAATEACGNRSSSAQDKNQLKFGIDKILGNSAFPANRRTDKNSVDAFDTGDRDSTNIGICGTTKHSEARGPVTAGNGWRDDYSAHPAGYPRRTSADDHAKTDCELPRKFSPVGDYCQGCYHDKSSLLPYNGSWSYSQYSYRLDHNHLYSSKESVPVQLPHPQQPHTTPNPRLPGRRKRSWSRAVFTNLQRKGLEKRFEMQKYVNKPDRRQLAAALGLTDAQVKVWFQNRRMKWRHFQRMQKQQRQAADKSSIEAGQQLTDDSSGTDEECLTADRSALPAAGDKDESLDRDRFTTDNHGLQRNKCSWMQK